MSRHFSTHAEDLQVFFTPCCSTVEGWWFSQWYKCSSSPLNAWFTSSFTPSPVSSLVSSTVSLFATFVGVDSSVSLVSPSDLSPSLASPSDLSPSTFSSDGAASFSLASSSAFSSVFDSSSSVFFPSSAATSSIKMAFSYSLSFHLYTFSSIYRKLLAI